MAPVLLFPLPDVVISGPLPDGDGPSKHQNGPSLVLAGYHIISGGYQLAAWKVPWGRNNSQYPLMGSGSCLRALGVVGRPGGF